MPDISKSEDKFIKDYRIKIGNKIRNLREKKGLSQNDLAEKIGVKISTISKIENGIFAVSIDYLIKISGFLNFDIILKEKI